MLSGFGLLLLLILGTAFYHVYEGLTIIDALYLTAMTVTTVGYGDFHPTTNEGKLFTIFLSLSGIAIALYFFTATQLYFIKIMDDIYKRISSQIPTKNRIVVDKPIIISHYIEEKNKAKKYKYRKERKKG